MSHTKAVQHIFMVASLAAVAWLTGCTHTEPVMVQPPPPGPAASQQAAQAMANGD